MGLRTLLLFPGIIILIAFIITENATIPTGTGNGGSISFVGLNQGNGPPPTTYTCTSSKDQCFTTGVYPTNAIIKCDTSAQKDGFGNPAPAPCNLVNNCYNVPNGAYCNYVYWVFPINTALDNGAAIYISASGQSQQVSTAATATFGYGTFTPAALLVLITVAVGVAALAGINVFGSGENAESVHILFIGGIFLGLWAILSALEGFVVNNPLSAFAQINVATGFPLGTGLYLMLTLLYVVGITGTISRGT